MMKIFFALVMMIALSSCAEDSSEADYQYKRIGLRPTINFESGTGIYAFTFKDHDYIQFGTGHTSSVVHDPECKKCKR